MGRASAGLTDWLEYFVATLSAVFDAARREALKYTSTPASSEPDELRRLDHRARTVLALFAHQEAIRSADVAQSLGLSERMVRVHLTNWVTDGWLQIADTSRRGRKYSLSESVRRHLGSQRD
jgi:hypothetical protein